MTTSASVSSELPRVPPAESAQQSLLDDPDRERRYIEPADLVREIVCDPLALETEEVSSFMEKTVQCTELRLLTEIIDGQRIHMHTWLCRPTEAPEPLAPVLLIPGGQGRIHSHREPAWIAATAGALVLAVDWVGAGLSDVIPGKDAWTNAMRFDGDYTGSYQYHNLRALMRATELLRSQPGIEDERLMAVGGSWGGFYSWLLAGVDERFTHIFPTFGCGFLDTEARMVWESYFASMGPEKTEEWLRAFDPGRRAHLVKAKVFYQQATNDRFYSLVASMETYRRVRTDKRLLLVHNQDHLTKPFNAQDVALLRSAIAGREWEGMPAVRDARWVPGTNLVELDVADPEGLELSVMYSGGRYTTSFARRWREAPVEQRDGRWVAEIPVVDPQRELWFYGHAVDIGPPPRGASTPVRAVVPAELGVSEPTAEFETSFDFRSGDLYTLPVGDRHFPAMRVVDDEGRRALAMRFGQDPSRRGVAYCLEGDLLAARGYNGIEVRVRVPDADDIAGLKLCLVTDFNAMAEQDYVIELDELDMDLTRWQSIRLPFAEFRSIVSRKYDYYQPPEQPMDVSRLCGVGFYHPSLSYRGEALLGGVRVVKMPDAPGVAKAPAQVVQEAPPVVEEAPPVVEEPAGAPAASPSVEGLRPYQLYVETPLSAEDLRPRLRRWAPWRYEVVFSNGVRTTEFPTAEPFVADPVSKWHVFKDHIPREAIQGRRALDVGSNIGHYSLFLRSNFDMEVVGLENNPRNLDVARFLVETTGLDRVSFRDEDASRFRAETPFDLILHLGTLDHFKDPFGAIENAHAMLAPGGYLALELQTYKDPGGDETICKFQPHTPGSHHTVWWLLGKGALLSMLDTAGFTDVKVLLEWSAPEKIGPTMRRLNVLARA